MCIRDSYKRLLCGQRCEVSNNYVKEITHTLNLFILPVPNCELDSKNLPVACKLSGGVCDDLNKRNNQENKKF